MDRGMIRVAAGIVGIVCGVISFLEGDRVTGVGLVAVGIGLLL